eukprot:COSAG05_NODE_704_length_7857_cov_2.807038_7_plen_92_part_00
MALLIVLTMSHPHVGFYSKKNICFYAKFYGQSFVGIPTCTCTASYGTRLPYMYHTRMAHGEVKYNFWTKVYSIRKLCAQPTQRQPIKRSQP